MDPNKKLHKLLSELDFEGTIKNLKESQIDVDFRDVTHGLQTLLMRLCHVPADDAKRREILFLILARNPSINIQDSSGRTALMHACIAEKLDIIQALSSIEDCDPNVVDEDINSALTYAVRSRKPHVVEILLVGFKDQGLNVNHRNKRGLTALEEGVTQLDSEISKLLIHLGGADASVLNHEQLSPYPARKNINAVLYGPTPRSPLSRRRVDSNERNESPRSLSAPNGTYHWQTSPSGTSDMLTVNSPSSRASSRASSLDDLQEDENEEEEEKEYLKYQSNLNKNRRNSLSLPDLRDIPNSLVSNCPTALLTASCERLHPERSLSRHGSDILKLPQLMEEELEDLDEHVLTFTELDHDLVTNYNPRRRNSTSLPDLRENLENFDNKGLRSDKAFVDHSENNQDKDNKTLLTHRKQQFQKICLSKNSSKVKLNNKGLLASKK